MGDVVNFRRKRLTGFLTDENVEEYRASITNLGTIFWGQNQARIEQGNDPPDSLDFPDSGDCA